GLQQVVDKVTANEAAAARHEHTIHAASPISMCSRKGRVRGRRKGVRSLVSTAPTLIDFRSLTPFRTVTPCTVFAGSSRRLTILVPGVPSQGMRAIVELRRGSGFAPQWRTLTRPYLSAPFTISRSCSWRYFAKKVAKEGLLP